MVLSLEMMMVLCSVDGLVKPLKTGKVVGTISNLLILLGAWLAIELF